MAHSTEVKTHVNFARRRVLFAELEGEVVDVLLNRRRVSPGDDSVGVGLQVLDISEISCVRSGWLPGTNPRCTER